MGAQKRDQNVPTNLSMCALFIYAISKCRHIKVISKSISQKETAQQSLGAQIIAKGGFVIRSKEEAEKKAKMFPSASNVYVYVNVSRYISLSHANYANPFFCSLARRHEGCASCSKSHLKFQISNSKKKADAR